MSLEKKKKTQLNKVKKFLPPKLRASDMFMYTVNIRHNHFSEDWVYLRKYWSRGNVAF